MNPQKLASPTIPESLNELGMIATVTVVQGADAPLSQDAVALLWGYFRSFNRRPLLAPDVWRECGTRVVSAAHTVGSVAAFFEHHTCPDAPEVSRESIRRALGLVSQMGIPYLTPDEGLLPSGPVAHPS